MYKQRQPVAWQESMQLSAQSGRAGYGRRPEGESRSVRIRVRVLWAVCILCVVSLISRIVYLQVFESDQQGLLSQANHIELVRETAQRGIIYDRNGIPLATNEVRDDKSVRVYPLGPAGAHVLGYLSEVRDDELGCSEGVCYNPGMLIGRSGVERSFEAQLKGRDGGVLKELDATGAVVRELGKNSPEPGSDLTLSLDSTLQQAMYSALGGKKGSAVALDMQGKVLGLVSSPAYDPMQVANYLSDTEELFFLNRAIAGVYPPGSVFKMVSGYAGLVSGAIDSETEIEDVGEITIGEYSYATWNFDRTGTKEGNLTLARALARSNDIYFYKLGEMVGITDLVKMAKQFGVGETTGIELSGEVGGLLPDPLWKERATGERWFLGNTYHLSIGQGDLLMSPLQVARMTLGAVSGRLCSVSLVKDSQADCKDIGIISDDLASVREGMRQACATGGTAFPFFTFEPYVICKTGTAQHSEQKDQDDPPHAWITVAYPGENPEMILTVMLESGGEGSAVAGAAAHAMLTMWRE